MGALTPPTQPLAELHREAAPAGRGSGEYHYKIGIFGLPLRLGLEKVDCIQEAVS